MGRHKKIDDFSWVPTHLIGLVKRDRLLFVCCVNCEAWRQAPSKQYIVDSADSYRLCRVCRDDRYSRFSNEDKSSWPTNHKRCGLCLEVKPLGDFDKNIGGVFDKSSRCKQCRKRMWPRYKKATFEAAMLVGARSRAKSKGLDFNISLEDIVIPELCPILQVPIERIRGSKYAPSLDRIAPSKGYVKGNVIVLSKRANTLKSNMTNDEAALLLAWLRQNRLQDDLFATAAVQNLP